MSIVNWLLSVVRSGTDKFPKLTERHGPDAALHYGKLSVWWESTTPGMRGQRTPNEGAIAIRGPLVFGVLVDRWNQGTSRPSKLIGIQFARRTTQQSPLVRS